jgi:hypothetical protein
VRLLAAEPCAPVVRFQIRCRQSVKGGDSDIAYQACRANASVIGSINFFNWPSKSLQREKSQDDDLKFQRQRAIKGCDRLDMVCSAGPTFSVSQAKGA